MCPKLLFWWIKSLGFLVQSCKYDFKNQKRTSNVQFFGLSKFLLSKIFHQLIKLVKSLKTNFQIAFYWFISMMSTSSLLTIPPATGYTPLHSYLLENNQKVALPASLIKNGAFTLSLEDRQYQYQSAKMGDYYSGLPRLIITLFCFGNQSLPVLAILSHFSSKFTKYSYSYILWYDLTKKLSRKNHPPCL